MTRESAQTTHKRLGSVRSQNTKPELLVRRNLHKSGFRYALGGSGLPGKPDITLTRYKSVIFVHGCYWHRHEGCKSSPMPKTNKYFWNEKFNKNIKRDKKAQEDLTALGWKVFTVWECELDDESLNKLKGKILEDVT